MNLNSSEMTIEEVNHEILKRERIKKKLSLKF